MIRSFADKRTAALFRRERVTSLPPDLHRVMLRKLMVLHAAERLEHLRVPPGNRLERLEGDRLGQYSIRVNRQWRLCFRWVDDGAEDVEIVDYH